MTKGLASAATDEAKGPPEDPLMGIQDVIRFFLPREDHFYDFLEAQAKAAYEGAKALVKEIPK